MDELEGPKWPEQPKIWKTMFQKRCAQTNRIGQYYPGSSTRPSGCLRNPDCG